MGRANFDFKFNIANNNTRMNPKEGSGGYTDTGAVYKGTNHMGRLIAFEPQRLYNFEIQIVGLDNLYTADNPGTQTDWSNEGINFPSAAERILVACSSFSVPNTEFGQIEIPHYNNTTKYAGKVTFGDAQLRVEQYLGSFTEQIMTTWCRCVYDPKTQNIGYKHDYAKDIFVIQYDSKGGTPRVWKMENAWPNVMPGADWDYNSTERRQMQFTIKCDRCIPDYGIDTRTFGGINSNDLNSITYSGIHGSVESHVNGYAGNKTAADGYQGNWVYDPNLQLYSNTATGQYFNGTSNTQK